MNSLNDLWTSNALIQAAGLPGQNCPDSTLYIVGLPIGNLGDITLRALWILALADVVAAEDTRETRKLLDKFGISVKLLSVREHNERHGAEQIIELLQEGKKVALVTDAGTPCVSDPGARAVKAVREAGFRVIPVPGASAVVTALSGAGLDGSGFAFVGFVPPQSKARRNALAYWLARPEPFVLYEAPHRVVDLLEDLAAAMEPERRVVWHVRSRRSSRPSPVLQGPNSRNGPLCTSPAGSTSFLWTRRPQRTMPSPRMTSDGFVQ